MPIRRSPRLESCQRAPHHTNGMAPIDGIAGDEIGENGYGKRERMCEEQPAQLARHFSLQPSAMAARISGFGSNCPLACNRVRNSAQRSVWAAR